MCNATVRYRDGFFRPWFAHDTAELNETAADPEAEEGHFGKSALAAAAFLAVSASATTATTTTLTTTPAKTTAAASTATVPELVVLTAPSASPIERDVP
jgi:hypothetical protein